MAELVVKVGSRSVQGRRANNEDRFWADADQKIFLVADGMGGQEYGERASELACKVIPRVLQDRLQANDCTESAVQSALDEANKEIIQEGQSQPAGRRMGTTAVLAVQRDDKVYVAGLGDSRAYLIRGGRAQQLTHDHTVAEALVRNGALTPEQAAGSPWSHVLYKFLGCVEMNEGADVVPFSPEDGDRLLLASDGLSNHVNHEDLAEGARRFNHPQEWANYLVDLALERGSRDNITCVLVAFDRENKDEVPATKY